MRTITFGKRHQYYYHKHDPSGTYRRGLPVTIDGMKFPDAVRLMYDLVNWYWYAGSSSVVVSGMPEWELLQLEHLGVFQRNNCYVVRVCDKSSLVEMIDTISLHMFNEPLKGPCIIGSGSITFFEGHGPQN